MLKRVNEEVRSLRFAICKSCDDLNTKFNINTCKICHCFMPAKTYLAAASCPVGRWLAENDQPEQPEQNTQAND